MVRLPRWGMRCGCLGLVPARVRPFIPVTASQQSQHCAALVPRQRVPRTWE